ncbi:MAG: leucine-rich repeat domain-containing protein, partial [Synergistaceae bacterium]|nr:leucine-rich repeat domain-containing protein [Synergistaceae bacterium]
KDFAFEDSSIAPTQQLPISLRVIGDNAFNDAIGLMRISWAASAHAMLETIGESAFVGTGLQEFNPAWIGGPAAAPARLINLKTIGKNAFLDVDTLEGTVNFEFSPIEKIAEGAFKNTNVGHRLWDPSLPAWVTHEVVFNETLQELADEAFYNTGIESIEFLRGYTGDEPATADEYFALFSKLGKKVFGSASVRYRRHETFNMLLSLHKI